METQVSIIVPTYNEEKNIKKLVSMIDKEDIPAPYEILVVDDGNDKTAEIARKMKCRVIIGKKQGLGQAIIDGIHFAKGKVLLVMDADLSHNPKSIPSMLRPIFEQGVDMTIGSRYVDGGGTKNWNLRRRAISRIACLCALPITGVKDATSGFFAFRKEILN